MNIQKRSERVFEIQSVRKQLISGNPPQKSRSSRAAKNTKIVFLTDFFLQGSRPLLAPRLLVFTDAQIDESARFNTEDLPMTLFVLSIFTV